MATKANAAFGGGAVTMVGMADVGTAPATVWSCGPQTVQRFAEAERFARSVYKLSGQFSHVFGATVCNDPGFNILLDLFLSAAEGKRRSVTAVCLGSRVAVATALRYLLLLEERGFVERVADPKDRRRSYVLLSADGWSRMLDLLHPPGRMDAEGQDSAPGRRAG